MTEQEEREAFKKEFGKDVHSRVARAAYRLEKERKKIHKRVDTKENVIKMVARLTDKKMRGEAVCVLVGHSKIVKASIDEFGTRVRCARCDTSIGYLQPASHLVHGHNNQANRKKYREMTWRDKLYVSTPFPNPR